MTWPRRQWTSTLQGFPGGGLSWPAERPVPHLPYPGALLSKFVYSPNVLVLTVGVAMTPASPVILPVGAVPSRYFFDPFPPGLSMSDATGVLSGTPTAPQAATIYNVRAKAGENSFTTISIQIDP